MSSPTVSHSGLAAIAPHPFPQNITMTNSPTPTTIEEAADRVLAQMDEANQAELRAMASGSDWNSPGDRGGPVAP
ncbi:hypothetical protein [Prochlorothrix hollandica]|uniref:Uncharacterized protein n=1 Tax=Prochlorothrix hollandica PCC 9006 = CALU 1027 TaxID=317619 RepID=A0A0M2Q293_PROHO|nr:hypothetical protein [Prochlorothrix hollandica]KKJ00742.1 hypothetical protein PROH_05595 [Prochlorothrix hollandica PCC 9006 = CALU 1027]